MIIIYNSSAFSKMVTKQIKKVSTKLSRGFLRKNEYIIFQIFYAGVVKRNFYYKRLCLKRSTVPVFAKL